MTILLATILMAVAVIVWGYQKASQRMVASRAVADSRGITLQTLIITAVLVLLAVAAGVVIVAITDNSSDDLEDQSSDLADAELQHGVLDDDGLLSYENCPTNSEITLISQGENAGNFRCSNACWVEYSERGDYKSLLLLETDSNKDSKDWSERSLMDDMDPVKGNQNGIWNGDLNAPDGWMADKESPLFDPITDFAEGGDPIYASRPPGDGFRMPRNNGEIVVLGQTCISSKDACDLSSSQRARVQSKIEPTRVTGGPVTLPALEALFNTLRGC